MKELARFDPFRGGVSMPDLARWNPLEDTMFVPALFRPVARRAGFGPRMDVIDTGPAYQLSVELPGVKKEAIQVNVYENTVTINAEMPEEKQAGEETTWLLRERTFGKLSRSIALPEIVDDASSEARFAEGVLYLKLQKKRATQTKRLAIH
jgi:HSP20 family protein